MYWPIWLHNQITSITSKPDGSVYCYDTTDVNRIFDSRLTYSKGAMILHMLRWIIGDSAYFAGLRNYLSDTNLAYKYACSDNLIAHMKSVSNKNLDEFFNDWLYKEGFPNYSVSCIHSDTSNNLQITINQTQSDPSSVSFFKMPVPIEFKDASHDTILVFDNTFSGQQYTVNPGFHADTLIFDPKLWLVCTHDPIVLGMKEYNEFREISIFPNPVTDILTVGSSNGNIQNVDIYDIRGRLVLPLISNPSANTELKINLSDLPDGIYFLKAIVDGNVLVKKITKL
jgi:hypothetical protein